MENEKLKVLEMLEKGTINAAEAQRLLECLEDVNAPQKKNVSIAENESLEGKKLRVKVFGTTNTEGKINVNVGVPLILARMADDIIANCVPSAVLGELKKEGVDLTQIKIGAIIDTIEALDEDIVDVDIDHDEAKLKVRVYVE